VGRTLVKRVRPFFRLFFQTSDGSELIIKV